MIEDNDHEYHASTPN